MQTDRGDPLPSVAVTFHKVEPTVAQAAAWERLWNVLLSGATKETQRTLPMCTDVPQGRKQE